MSAPSEADVGKLDNPAWLRAICMLCQTDPFEYLNDVIDSVSTQSRLNFLQYRLVPVKL